MKGRISEVGGVQCTREVEGCGVSSVDVGKEHEGDDNNQ